MPKTPGTKLTNIEKLNEMVTNKARTKLQQKKINILRKGIYDTVHSEETLRWEHVVSCIGNLYLVEYANV